MTTPTKISEIHLIFVRDLAKMNGAKRMLVTIKQNTSEVKRDSQIDKFCCVSSSEVLLWISKNCAKSLLYSLAIIDNCKLILTVPPIKINAQMTKIEARPNMR